jgi:hypothetical protein
MTKLFYQLEDYFDALAQRPRGFSRWLARALSTLFAFAGDLIRGRISSPKRPLFDADFHAGSDF